MAQKILITGALPYANGKVHLGHLAGAYLPADTFARWKRLKGDDVCFICGSDEHGVPITLSALKRGCSPQDVVDEYHPANGAAFASAKVEFDYWGRTSSAQHHALSQSFFKRLFENGYIDRRQTQQYYSEKSQMFLPDRYVIGTCPNCGNENARGDECENCGKPYEVTELRNARCNLPGDNSVPIVKSTEHFFLKLEAFQAPLEKWVSSHEAGGALNWRLNTLRGAEGWLKSGLRSRGITRDTTWGVKIPFDEPGLEGKRMYVWFDAPIGYVTFTQQYFAQKGQPEGWKEFWQNPNCSIYNFIGKDNIPFHAIIWPAMQLGVNDKVPAGEKPYQLVTQVVANEFLTFAGEKGSKSKGNAVEIEDFVKLFGADPLRYYLTAIAPEESDSSFTWEDFSQRYNTELANVLGNFIHRSATFTHKFFGGVIPEGGAPTELENALRAETKNALADSASFLDALRFKAALARLIDLARAGNKYFDERAPWKLNKTDPVACGTVIRCCAETSAALGLGLRPFLPDSAAKILSLFGLVGVDVAKAGSANLNPLELAVPGKTLAVPEVIFKKIEPEDLPTPPVDPNAAKPVEKPKKEKKPKEPGS